MNTEKMKEVFADEAFVKSLFELESAAEVQAALKEKGFDLSDEEVETVRNYCAKLAQGELPEDMLDMVAGGGISKTYMTQMV